MRTPVRQLPAATAAGGLSVLLGVTVLRLGIEFEGAWLRSDDGPLLGDDLPARSSYSPQRARVAEAIPAAGDQHHRLVTTSSGRLI